MNNLRWSAHTNREPIPDAVGDAQRSALLLVNSRPVPVKAWAAADALAEHQLSPVSMSAQGEGEIMSVIKGMRVMCQQNPESVRVAFSLNSRH